MKNVPLLSAIPIFFAACDGEQLAKDIESSSEQPLVEDDDHPPPPDHAFDRPPISVLRRMLECKVPPAEAHRWGPPRAFLTAYDLDDDGQLSPSEREPIERAAKEGCALRRGEFIERFDADRDGEISDVELARASEIIHAEMEERRSAFEAEFDANHDGIIDRSERETARAAREFKRPPFLDAGGVQAEVALSAEARSELRARIEKRLKTAARPRPF